MIIPKKIEWLWNARMIIPKNMEWSYMEWSFQKKMEWSIPTRGLTLWNRHKQKLCSHFLVMKRVTQLRTRVLCSLLGAYITCYVAFLCYITCSITKTWYITWFTAYVPTDWIFLCNMLYNRTCNVIYVTMDWIMSLYNIYITYYTGCDVVTEERLHCCLQ